MAEEGEEGVVQGEISFAQLAERLLADLAESRSSVEECKSKRAIVQRHLLPALGHLPVSQVNLAAIQHYKERQLERGLSRKTINNHLVVVRAVLALAVTLEWIDVAPPIQSFPLEVPDLNYLDFEEARRLVQAADEDWRLMIALALRTGLRLGELRALTWENVDFENLRLHVQPRVREGRERSTRARDIPLSEETAFELRQHPRRGPWVFCSEQGEMLTHGACKWPLYRAARRAGLEQLGWDALRRTFAAHLTLRGAPLASVQALLGNRSLSTTLRYTQLGAQGARAAIALLDVRDCWGAAVPRVRLAPSRAREFAVRTGSLSILYGTAGDSTQAWSASWNGGRSSDGRRGRRKPYPKLPPPPPERPAPIVSGL